MRETVYLAGKMAGLTLDQMNSWRSCAEQALRPHGFIPLNPVSTKLGEDPSDREIVDSNKFQILKSTVVLVELDNVQVSIGTIGEIVFAREHRKPVIAWGSAHNIIDHPWVKEHTTVHFYELTDAIKYLIENYAVS